MKITKSQLKRIIKEELNEVETIDLTDLEPGQGAEQRMEALSNTWTKHINNEIWQNVEVLDPISWERRDLDEFISILGNYVVSGEIESAHADELVREIAATVASHAGVVFEPDPHDWGIPDLEWSAGGPYIGKGPEGVQEESRKARDSAARRRRQKREEDPKYQAVKRAYEKHLEKERKKREELGIEESSQSGGSSQSKEAEKLDPTAHQWSSKGRKKAASKKRRARAKKGIKKGETK